MSHPSQRALATTRLGLALLLAVQGIAGEQSRIGPAPKPAPKPFRVGERLEYQIGWSNFLTAATATLLVLEQRTFEGRPAWHLRARSSTVGGVRFIYELDDQYDSYSDVSTLESLQYEQFQRHEKRNEQKTVRMGSDPAQGPAGSHIGRVPSSTRDPLGAYYWLRTIDWDSVGEASTQVYDGTTRYEMRARVVVSEEMARVPAGNFRATKIEVRMFEQGSELTDTRFWLWLAKDGKRTPVLVEATLPFGTLQVELKSATQVAH